MKLAKPALVRKLVFVLFGPFLLASCGDECSDYSNYSCKQIANATYNVYFYFPNEREEYLGIANGLEQCGGIAGSYAAEHNMSRSDSWSYICCMKTGKSECEEKHR